MSDSSDEDGDDNSSVGVSSLRSHQSLSRSSTRPPSLLEGLDLPSLRNPTDPFSLPPRPRRVWKISDHPPCRSVFDVPLNKQTTAFVSDVPASFVAIRIAECLRLRSISAEFTDFTAHCMTINRVHFLIQLYSGRPSRIVDGKVTPDFSHGVVVSIQRVRGDCRTFYAHCRKILLAAQSLDTGKDDRSLRVTPAWEWPRILNIDDILPDESEKTFDQVAKTAKPALDEAVGLMKKDRWDAQELGWHALLHTVDPACVGLDVALFAGCAVLQLDFMEEWLLPLIVEERLPREVLDAESSSGTEQSQDDHDHDISRQSTVEPSQADAWKHVTTGLVNSSLTHDALIGGTLRALAISVLARALTLLRCYKPKLLATILPTLPGKLTTPLMSDLKTSPNRPPSVVNGSRMSSTHESALVLTILQTLGSAGISQDDLERACLVGKAVHAELDRAATAILGDVDRNKG